MPSTSKPARLPVMRLFRPRNRAYIKLGGRRHYLGPWGSAEADANYRLKVRELLGVEHPPTAQIPAAAPSASRPGVQEITTPLHLAEAFTAWARLYYVKGGRPTHSAANVARVRDLMERSRLCDGPLERADPEWLRDLRTRLVELTRTSGHSLTRETINEYTAIVVRMFRFGATNGLADALAWQALRALQPIGKGRPPAPHLPPLPEGRAVQPVPREHIRAARLELTRTVRIMLNVQLLTGMRPNEVCWIRPCDLQPTKNPRVKIYHVPAEANKTEHEEHALPRLIWLGPRALRLLAMVRPTPHSELEHYFRPAVALGDHAADLAGSRKTPLYPSHSPQSRRGRRRAAGIAPAFVGPRYSPDSYRRAMERACGRAGVEPFTPYRLRHNAATELANREQIQVAQVMLGHKSIQTTARYVKPWEKHAVRAALKYG